MSLSPENKALVERALGADAEDALLNDLFTTDEVVRLLDAARSEGWRVLGREEVVEALLESMPDIVTCAGLGYLAGTTTLDVIIRETGDAILALLEPRGR